MRDGDGGWRVQVARTRSRANPARCRLASSRLRPCSPPGACRARGCPTRTAPGRVTAIFSARRNIAWASASIWTATPGTQSSPARQPRQGYDMLRRKSETWGKRAILGWVDVGTLLTEKSAAPTWLGGWWKVTEGPQTWYYYFDFEGGVYCPARGTTDAPVRPDVRQRVLRQLRHRQRQVPDGADPLVHRRSRRDVPGLRVPRQGPRFQGYPRRLEGQAEGRQFRRQTDVRRAPSRPVADQDHLCAEPSPRRLRRQHRAQPDPTTAARGGGVDQLRWPLAHPPNPPYLQADMSRGGRGAALNAPFGARLRRAMAKRDFYEILGVAKTATDAELKAAFRKTAMSCHPDRNPGDKQAEARFKELNEAYQHLSDAAEARGLRSLRPCRFRAGRGPRRHGRRLRRLDVRHFRRPVRRHHGPARRAQSRRQGARRGSALQSRNHAGGGYKGKNASIKLPTSIACEACQGPGAQARLQAPVTCRTCAGWGGCASSRASSPSSAPARPATGAVETIDNPCDRCAGWGSVKFERTLYLHSNVPAGVEDGTRIRLSGEGEAGLRGGGQGDLYIFLAIKPHPFFQRDGADLYCRVPISMVQASLGGEFSVRTLDGGDAKVQIPEGTQSGRKPKTPSQGYADPALARFRRPLHTNRGGDAAESHPTAARFFIDFDADLQTKRIPKARGS